MIITESKIRLVVREELIKTLYKQGLISEGYFSDKLKKYKKYGGVAALGSLLGAGALQVTDPLGDSSNTDLASNTINADLPVLQDIGYNITSNNNTVTISKGGKSISVDKAAIEKEETFVDSVTVSIVLADMTTKKGDENKYTSRDIALDTARINSKFNEDSLPESKKVVQFLRQDPQFIQLSRKSGARDFGTVGLIILALVLIMNSKRRY